MTTTYTLTTIQQLVELGTMLPHSWFRGHPEACGALDPRAFRKEYECTDRWRGKFEQPMMEKFKSGAPVLMSTTPPANDDNISWLFLMQHHGSPTRLLDWTESPLVAMYFVVMEHESVGGELWVMDPKALNKMSDFNGILLPGSEVVSYLAAEPKYSDLGPLQKKFHIPTLPRNPVALQPPMGFPRMIAQLSTFTIHPKQKPYGRGATIPELLQDPKQLVRYLVPAESKSQLKNDLASLGITHRALFPDLDGLSKTIIDARKGKQSPCPNPPHWG